jgi:hypothetical protein
MLTIAEAQRQTELFLTSQMFEALHAIEYELPSFDTEAREVHLADVARSRVEIRHVRGASDATYLVNAFGDELLMQLQLNVHRPRSRLSRAGARCARCEHPCCTFGALAHWRRACRLEIRLARCADCRRSRPALCRNLLLRLRRHRFSRRRAAAALLAHRHRADDQILHDRGGAQRHPPLTTRPRVPSVV